jgi:hypothetical protein
MLMVMNKSQSNTKKTHELLAPTLQQSSLKQVKITFLEKP